MTVSFYKILLPLQRYQGRNYFPGFESAHHPALALLRRLVLRCQRRCVYVLFIQPSQTDTAPPPGPCYAPDRQLKGDFWTHLGLGSLLGGLGVRLGPEKVKRAASDVLTRGCYVKHVCAQTSFVGQTKLVPEKNQSILLQKQILETLCRTTQFIS